MTFVARNARQSGTYRQKNALYLIVVTTRLITGLISLHWQQAGTGQYFALILAFLLALTGVCAVAFLCRRARKPLFEAIGALCGRWASVAVALIFALFLIHSAQSLLYILSDIITAQTLPNGTRTAVVIAAAATAALAASCGMEALGRFARLCGAPILAVLAVSLLLPLENYRPDYLFPLLGNGPRTLLSLGVSASADFFGAMLFGLVYDPAQDDRVFLRTMWTLPACALGLCLLFFLSIALIFPYSVNGTIPLFDLLSVISAGQHVQTLAALFSFLWSSAFLITSGAQLLFCVRAVETAFPPLRRRRKWTVALLAAGIAALALVGQDIREAYLTARSAGWLALYPPLWLCALIALCRGRGKERS